MPELYPAVAAVIKEARLAAGLSQHQLADFCGLSRSYISFVECGERGLSVTALYQIGVAVGVPGSELFRRIEGMVATNQKRGSSSFTEVSGKPRSSASKKDK